MISIVLIKIYTDIITLGDIPKCENKMIANTSTNPIPNGVKGTIERELAIDGNKKRRGDRKFIFTALKNV